MREVGERDKRARADPQELIDHQIGTPCRLECLTENGIVETGVGIVSQIGIGIALYDRQPARERRRDVTCVNLDTAGIAALGAQFRH